MKNDKRQASRVRLEHILKAIEEIESYTLNQTLVSFSRNKILIDAVLFKFSIIGEAVVHVDKEILDRHDYPWYKVRAFRNLIAHEYFNIKPEAVWIVIERDLIGLKHIISEMIISEAKQ